MDLHDIAFDLHAPEWSQEAFNNPIDALCDHSDVLYTSKTDFGESAVKIFTLSEPQAPSLLLSALPD